MSTQPSGPAPAGDRAEPALSFASVADAYERARPSYPTEAAAWLVGTPAATVVELGAGTGKLTASLVEQGHDVLAVDPLVEMLAHLRARLPDVRTTVATAEEIPVASRTVDVVVAAQAFHWFDLDRALPEIARVLKPGGYVALVWNLRDDRIPWVRRLGSMIGSQEQLNDPTDVLVASQLFGYVDSASFRFWQPLRKAALRDLVRSRSNIAVMTETRREAVLSEVDALYDEYGRGPGGLLLPYVTRCFRAKVRPHTPAAPPEAESEPDPQGPDAEPPTILIDFR